MAETHKISDLIVGLILFSMVIGVLGLFIGNMALSSGRTYDNSSFENYNKLQELTAEARVLENQSNIKGNENALDVIGNYFSSGYKTLLVTTTSFSYFNEMSSEAVSQTNIGASASIYKTGFSTILLIIIIIGILLAAIMKWPT